MIDKLTSEQEALIPVYREKWRAIALSTEPLDRKKAADAVKAIYAAIGQQEPKITFFDSPHAAYQNLLLLDSLPSCQFADGFSVYAYHGVRLPEKYGKVHPQHRLAFSIERYNLYYR